MSTGNQQQLLATRGGPRGKASPDNTWVFNYEPDLHLKTGGAEVITLNLRVTNPQKAQHVLSELKLELPFNFLQADDNNKASSKRINPSHITNLYDSNLNGPRVVRGPRSRKFRNDFASYLS